MAKPALRLGLRLVKSLSTKARSASSEPPARAAVRERPGSGETRRRSIAEISKRWRRPGALAALSGNRHLAFWEVAGTERPLPLAPAPSRPETREGRPLLAAPTEGQSIVADYASVGLTLGRHPMALLRERLRKQTAHRGRSASVSRTASGYGPPASFSCASVRKAPAASRSSRSRTRRGQVNLIVWESVWPRAAARDGASRDLLEVHGELQREEGVTHVIARRAHRSLGAAGGAADAIAGFSLRTSLPAGDDATQWLRDQRSAAKCAISLPHVVQVLPAAQRTLWASCQRSPNEFVLYGASLALHLGHRTSVDFDACLAENACSTFGVRRDHQCAVHRFVSIHARPCSDARRGEETTSTSTPSCD